jgi:hypothetical protein
MKYLKHASETLKDLFGTKVFQRKNGGNENTGKEDE